MAVHLVMFGFEGTDAEYTLYKNMHHIFTSVYSITSTHTNLRYWTIYYSDF